MFIKFSVKEIGTSHLEKNIPCQDATLACLGQNSKVGIACVADGHGGSKYFRSHKGSIFAVQVAEKSLLDFYGTIAREKLGFFNFKEKNEEKKSENIIKKIKELESNIIYNWCCVVKKDIKENEFTASELEICRDNNIIINDPENLLFIYGSTLIASLISDNFWFVIKIGDGNCVIINDEQAYIPSELEDARLSFGRTTSLCDSEAIDNFRESFGFSRINGLTVATDGITDSFEPEKYLQFNIGLYKKFISFPDCAEKELQEFLPDISSRGSRDDISIAGIFRMNKR
jgi:serine/threonine protein phosphatase PrpC